MTVSLFISDGKWEHFQVTLFVLFIFLVPPSYTTGGCPAVPAIWETLLMFFFELQYTEVSYWKSFTRFQFGEATISPSFPVSKQLQTTGLSTKLFPVSLCTLEKCKSYTVHFKHFSDVLTISRHEQWGFYESMITVGETIFHFCTYKNSSKPTVVKLWWWNTGARIAKVNKASWNQILCSLLVSSHSRLVI